MCDFYYSAASPPCRSVLMLAKALNVHLNLKKMSLSTGEHLKPEFLKINPQHTIPTLVDEDFALWESRAILTYLVEKYAIKNLFYSADIQKRARINRLMYFDMGTLYKSFSDYYYPIYKNNESGDPEKLKKIDQSMELLDVMLKDSRYAACDQITIADYALVATISTFDVVGYEIKKFENVNRWFELCKSTLPGIEANEQGIEEMKMFVENLKNKLN